MDFAKIKKWATSTQNSSSTAMCEADLSSYPSTRSRTMSYLLQITTAYEQQQAYVTKVEEMNKQLFKMLGSPTLVEVEEHDS